MEPTQVVGNGASTNVRLWIVAVLAIAATAFGAVIALGFFAVVKTPVVQDYFIAANRKAEIDIVSICQAVDNFTIMNGGRPPESLEVLVTPDENGKTFLRDRTSIPTDPWNNPYGYEPPTNNRDYRVFTLGRDGKIGGGGDDADIDNVTIVVARSH